MSIRSLIEINHDFTHRLDESFIDALERYLNSASAESADDLERYGVRVISLRHHTGRYYLKGEPDGFPVIPVDRTPPAERGPSGRAKPKTGSTRRTTQGNQP